MDKKEYLKQLKAEMDKISNEIYKLDMKMKEVLYKNSKLTNDYMEIIELSKEECLPISKETHILDMKKMCLELTIIAIKENCKHEDYRRGHDVTEVCNICGKVFKQYGKLI